MNKEQYEKTSLFYRKDKRLIERLLYFLKRADYIGKKLKSIETELKYNRRDVYFKEKMDFLKRFKRVDDLTANIISIEPEVYDKKKFISLRVCLETEVTLPSFYYENLDIFETYVMKKIKTLEAKLEKRCLCREYRELELTEIKYLPKYTSNDVNRRYFSLEVDSDIYKVNQDYIFSPPNRTTNIYRTFKELSGDFVLTNARQKSTGQKETFDLCIQKDECISLTDIEKERNYHLTQFPYHNYVFVGEIKPSWVDELELSQISWLQSCALFED